MHNYRFPKESLLYPLWRDRHLECERLSIYLRGKKEESYSPKEIWEKSLYWRRIIKSKTDYGDRVSISLPNGIEFVSAFYGCLLAGRIPVPIVHQLMVGEKEFADFVVQIDNVADVKILITDVDLNSSFKIPTLNTRYVQGETRFFDNNTASDEEVEMEVQEILTDVGFGEDLCFLQFSSGSTSDPKAVMLSHQALLTNIREILQLLRPVENDKLCTWLPLYHDMGLIGGFLAPMASGHPIIMSTPVDFIRSPYNWLRTISETKGTVIIGPDFSYRQFVKRVDEKQLRTLDLSSVRVAMSGAEPVNYKTICSFIDKFSRVGLRGEALLPVYGMAENCLAVTFPKIEEVFNKLTVSEKSLLQGKIKKSESNDDCVHLVSCGQPLESVEIKIVRSLVDERALKEIPDGFIGQILIRSKSLTSGYYKNPATTSEQFTTIEGKQWLKTGDLGFFNESELYVTGRLKDQIIINGRNIDPIDIERSLLEIKGHQLGRIVAVPTKDANGDESVAVVCESRSWSRRKRDLARKAILNSSYGKFPLEEKNIYIVPPNTLPRTSSGKVKRYLVKSEVICREIDEKQKRFIRFRFVSAISGLSLVGNYWWRPFKERLFKKEETSEFKPASIDPNQDFLDWLKFEFSKSIEIPVEKIDEKTNFSNFAVDSVKLVQLHERLSQEVAEIPLAKFIQIENLQGLFEELKGERYAGHISRWRANRQEDQYKSKKIQNASKISITRGPERTIEINQL